MKDELVDIVMNIHQFNQDLTTLNIKQAETIEEQKDNENGIFNGAIDMLEVYLNKLQELKGDDK